MRRQSQYDAMLFDLRWLMSRQRQSRIGLPLASCFDELEIEWIDELPITDPEWVSC